MNCKKICLILGIILLFNIPANICFSEDLTFYPQRIVSLAPSITEELYLLRVENKIVGTSIYCTRPPQAQNKEKVGTLIKANLEKIARFQPDLVIVTSLANPKDVVKLKNLGIRVASFPRAESFSQICEQFLELSRIVGREDRAKDIIRQAKKKVKRIKQKTNKLPKQKVFVQIGASPLYAATQNSFINDLIEFAGGENIVSGSRTGFYSRERVLKANPDVIIIVIMGIAGKKEKQLWQGYAFLNAAKGDRIYIVDANKFCIPTPLTFAEALMEMAEILHPESKPH